MVESFDAGDKCWEALVVFLVCANLEEVVVGNKPGYRVFLLMDQSKDRLHANGVSHQVLDVDLLRLHKAVPKDACSMPLESAPYPNLLVV